MSQVRMVRATPEMVPVMTAWVRGRCLRSRVLVIVCSLGSGVGVCR